MSRGKLKLIGLFVLFLIAAIQFIQPDRSNPPADPAAGFEAVVKPGGQVLQAVQKACYNCHSQQTVWPWYSRIAPASWLVAGDVNEGRARLNFSQWNLLSPEMSQTRLKAACQEVKKGEMPPWYYLLVHPNARLSDEEIAALCAATGLIP